MDVECGETITLKVKHTSDPRESQLTTSPYASVRELKQRVAAEFDAVGKHVRLICSGKMLEPDSAQLQQFGLKDGSYVHCVITSSAPGTAPRRAAAPPPPRPVNPAELRGLDRLQADGLTVDEVAALRSSFRQHIDLFAANVHRRPLETESEYRMRVEEEWMQAQDATTEFGMNVFPRRQEAAPTQSVFSAGFTESYDEVGTVKDYLWGFFMGFLLGFVMLFWLWDRSISHRQKMGIMSGVATQLALGILRKGYYTDNIE